jgi:hypothetical protein
LGHRSIGSGIVGITRFGGGAFFGAGSAATIEEAKNTKDTKDTKNRMIISPERVACHYLR